jgi:hypothetical protein
MSRTHAQENADSDGLLRDRIRQALTAKGLTPGDVDRRFSLSAGYLGKVLRKERKLIARVVAEVALLTGTDEAWLRTGAKPNAAEAQAAYDLGVPKPLAFCPYCGRRLPGEEPKT